MRRLSCTVLPGLIARLGTSRITRGLAPTAKLLFAAWVGVGFGSLLWWARWPLCAWWSSVCRAVAGWSGCWRAWRSRGAGGPSCGCWFRGRAASCGLCLRSALAGVAGCLLGSSGCGWACAGASGVPWVSRSAWSPASSALGVCCLGWFLFSCFPFAVSLALCVLPLSGFVFSAAGGAVFLKLDSRDGLDL